MWMGVAAFLNYVSVPHYLYDIFFVEQYETFTNTIFRAFPKIMRVLTCFLPIMLGYVVVGTMLFGKETVEFATLGDGFSTLFSVAQGASVLDTINHLKKSSFGIFGTFYIITFMLLFVYFFLTISIAIMENTYLEVVTEGTYGMHGSPSTRRREKKCGGRESHG